jgi:hypothetical protein
MEMSPAIQAEIRKLELEKEDVLCPPERRRMLDIETHLLRNGYRIVPIAPRTLGIQSWETSKIVYETTYNELRYASIQPGQWLKMAQESEI